jgi:hypothetical protein
MAAAPPRALPGAMEAEAVTTAEGLFRAEEAGVEAWLGLFRRLCCCAWDMCLGGGLGRLGVGAIMFDVGMQGGLLPGRWNVVVEALYYLNSKVGRLVK